MRKILPSLGFNLFLASLFIFTHPVFAQEEFEEEESVEVVEEEVMEEEVVEEVEEEVVEEEEEEVFVEEAVPEEKEGILWRISRSLANLPRWPDLFSELTPEDVGYKPRIRPHFASTQGFTSNARIGSSQDDPAWQARVVPGITLILPSGKLYSEFDYTYGFSTTQGRKTSANINTHNLNALARYEWTRDTSFGVGNNAQWSEVPGEGGDTFFLETAIGQFQHRLGPKLSVNLIDTFQWFRDQTEASAFQETNDPAGTSRRREEFNNEFVDNGILLDLPYEVTKDLRLSPRFGWNVRNFVKANAKDYWQIQPALTASYRLGPKTTLGGNFGWALRHFDETANTTVGHHESELVYAASVSHLLGRKLIWLVSYVKTLADTFETGFVFRETPEATTLDNLDRDFRVIKSHRITSTVTYHLNEKNSFRAFGDFAFLFADADDNIISRRKNDEKLMEIGAGYTYRLNRYLAFDLFYAFGRRFSSENLTVGGGRDEYTFHKVSGGVNVWV